MDEKHRTQLGYEPAGHRAGAPPISICMTMMICGTALVLAPWVFLSQVDFRFLFDNVLRAMLVGLTFCLGAGMIVLAYLHARR
jgi:hypothetical protein